MLKQINGRGFFRVIRPKNSQIALSLSGFILGIFLFPQIAYLSAISPEQIINLTNRERQASGLNSLNANSLLAQAAQKKGEAILAAQIFGHTIEDRKFSSWIRDTGYDYSYVGENLAIDFSSSEAVLAAWKNSAAHKQNLLSPYYKEIGIAAVAGAFAGQDTTVVVQIFGAPAAAAAAIRPEVSLNFSRASLYADEFSLPLSQFGRESNSLTAARLKQLSRFNLSHQNFLSDSQLIIGQANKSFVQPLNYNFDNFLIIFLSSCLAYLGLMLYFHYFKKIKTLASA